jgi:hypothetical protein
MAMSDILPSILVSISPLVTSVVNNLQGQGVGCQQRLETGACREACHRARTSLHAFSAEIAGMIGGGVALSRGLLEGVYGPINVLELPDCADGSGAIPHGLPSLLAVSKGCVCKEDGREKGSEKSVRDTKQRS